MRFNTATLMDLQKVQFRVHDYIFPDNKNGFFVTQGAHRMMELSVDLHEDHYGGDIFLCEALDIREEIRVYYGDRDWVEVQLLNEEIYRSQSFEDKYSYAGELGCICEGRTTIFRLWSPLAIQAWVDLYKEGRNMPYQSMEMTYIGQGVYELVHRANLHGTYYMYTISMGGEQRSCADPYAKACGVNGTRSMAVELSRTDPPGFDASVHQVPEHITDAVLYEMSVRDFSMAENSGVSAEKRGRFLGFTEEATKSPDGETTCLAHLKELGITHVHLLPVMDFTSVDETKPFGTEYNWGYDPQSYFCLEGSLASDARDGAVRIREFKCLVQALHENGIGVVLDVVYNHTGRTEDSNFNQLVPNYYHRRLEGHFTNGSGCGNELDTEKSMVRKMILDSVLYWVREYGVDGFRFDLMGLIDIETMNLIREELDKIDPRLLTYGEGWTGGLSLLPPEKQSVKYNAGQLYSRIALFNDEYRDLIKGNTFDAKAGGYPVLCRDFRYPKINMERVEAGIVAQTLHPHVEYTDGMGAFAQEPTQTITYSAAHDNYTLHDKLYLSASWARGWVLEEVYRLCACMVLLAQGTPFLMGGEEFLRSKPLGNGQFEHDSYSSPDTLNQIDWSLKGRNNGTYQYYRGLIALRKAHPAFRIHDRETLASSLRFIYTQPYSRSAFILDGNLCGDSLSEIAVIINPTTDPFICDVARESRQMSMNPFGVYVDKQNASLEPMYTLEGSKVEVPPVGVMVLGR